MSVVSRYLTGLRQVLPQADLESLALAHGASEADLQRLTTRFPHCPAALLELLREVDGTHWRQYPGGEVSVLMLGSDVYEYPYYLSSVQQMLEQGLRGDESIAQVYADYLDEWPELIGPGIDPHLPMGRRLCFSECMNNGGTSQLYLDFDPAPGGTVGQVVRFLHDPDSYAVIAPSFEAYLQALIDEQYAFVHDDED